MTKYQSFVDWLWHQKLGRPYQLNYRLYGQGDKPLLLLHGLAATHLAWRPLIRLVRREWKIVAPDLLGFGLSPTPEWNSYDVHQHARHVRALLRRFRINEPVTIVAHSMGCLIAVRLAVTYPGLVERLILYEPPLFADAPDYRAHARARARYFAVFKYIATHPQLIFSTTGETKRRISVLSGVSLKSETWIPFSRSIENTIMDQETYDELHAIKIPTAIVYGRLDFVVPRTDIKKMLAQNPNVSFHSVTSTHDLSVRAARELTKLLRGKLNGYEDAKKRPT